MTTNSDTHKQIYIVALLFGILITLFTSVYFFLGIFETVYIYGKVTDESGSIVSDIPIYIYFDNVLIGIDQSSSSADFAHNNFVFQISNEAGLTSSFPGSAIDIDFGTVPVNTSKIITQDNLAIEVRVGNRFNNNTTVQATSYFNSRTVKLIIVGVISISMTVFFTYCLIKLSNSSEPINDLSTIPQNTREKGNIYMSQELIPIAIPFLIEVGRFAMKELRQKWEAKPKDNAHDSIDLSNEEDVKVKVPLHLNNVSNDTQIIKILQNHHSILQRQMVQFPRTRTEIKAEYDAGKILIQHRTLQLEEIEQRIQETAKENERIIEQLGFEISKEQLE